MVILFLWVGILGNLFGEKLVWGLFVLAIILAAITAGGSATISLVLCSPAICRTIYNIFMKR